MKLLIPFTPHIAYESLELLKCKKINWPDVRKDLIENINLAVQINGKTRDIIKINKDLKEEDVNQIIIKNSKANKYISNNKISKIIFVKNKIINYIISK